jgi:hypothetical protein
MVGRLRLRCSGDDEGVEWGNQKLRSGDTGLYRVYVVMLKLDSGGMETRVQIQIFLLLAARRLTS